MEPMRVLLATDDSSEARQATVWLRDLALSPDTVVCVVTVATLMEPPRDSRSLTALREALRVEARGAVVQGRPRPLERVLVAVDQSAASRAAIDFLARCELAADTRVLLLHVLPELPVPGGRRSTESGGGESGSVPLRNEQADAARLLADAGTVLAALPCPVEPMVVGGDPARKIVRVARKHDVDLVVLGARGLRTLGRLLLGSVSEAVLHHAGRAVMIVRER